MKVMYVQLISGKLKLFHQMSIHLLKMNQLSPGRIQCEFTEGGTLTTETVAHVQPHSN